MAFHIFDKKVKENLPNYIIQSALATIAMIVVLLVLNITTQQAIIIAAIGSSAFIVFAMPHQVTATPRRLIGGHMVGVVVGNQDCVQPADVDIPGQTGEHGRTAFQQQAEPL